MESLTYSFEKSKVRLQARWFVLALAYGSDVDWCRNVLAAGKCTLKWKGREYALARPEIIPAKAALQAYPLSIRFAIARGVLKQCSWVHRQREVPEVESLVT